MSETPAERLNRLRDSLLEQQKRTTPKKGNPPAETGQEIVEHIVEQIKKHFGSGADVEVEVKPLYDDDSPVIALGIEAHRKPQPPIEDDEERLVSLPYDPGPLESIEDPLVREHAEAILRNNSAVAATLNAMGEEHPVTTFATAMGLIVVRAGLSGAMIVSGKSGATGVTPQAFTEVMTGAIATAIYSAFRYGQQHPDALTEVDGVDHAVLEAALDKFLAEFSEPPMETEEGTENKDD